MASTIDDLTIAYEENGKELTKELDKVVLSKGAWSTIIYRYQSWDEKNQDYSEDKYSVRRYQKREGEYMQRSKFNISNRDQAQKIIDALTKWINE